MVLSSLPAVGPAGAASRAAIASVAFGGTKLAPTVVINGVGFGAAAPSPIRAGNQCELAALGAFYGDALNVQDLTGRWKAGSYVAGQLGFFNAIIIDSWTNTRIAFHFDGCWTDHGKTLNRGDASL